MKPFIHCTFSGAGFAAFAGAEIAPTVRATNPISNKRRDIVLLLDNP